MQSIMPAESAHLDHRLCVADPHEAEQGDHEDLGVSATITIG